MTTMIIKEQKLNMDLEHISQLKFIFTRLTQPHGEEMKI